MMMKHPFAATFWVFVFALACLARDVSAQAAEADFAPFVGNYAGEVMVETPTGPAKRELEVLVLNEAQGFSVEWSTDTIRADGRVKSDTYFIAFTPTERPGIYLPTEKVVRKGETIQIDPLYGDPQLLMCKIEGKTMTIFAAQ